MIFYIPIVIGLVMLALSIALFLKFRSRRWSKGLLIAGIGLMVLSLFPFMLAVARSSEEPLPIQSAEATSPPSQPPAALITAQDYLAQGDYEFEQGDPNAALAAYSQAITLKPDFAQAYNNRAYTYMRLEDYAAALPDLDRAIELRPDYVNALMNRGDIYNFYYNVDFKRAISDYDRVIALGATGTSVCGHRLIALNHGWNLLVFFQLAREQGRAGCETSPE